ncbi:MAG: hypothetical protein WAS07_01345 [Micropruina sp.]
MNGRSSRWHVRLAGATLAAVVLLGGVGCSATQRAVGDAAVIAVVDSVDRTSFAKLHPNLFVADDRGPGMESVSVLNYDPNKFPVPSRQEVVGYGHLGSSPKNFQQVVRHVSVMEGEKFYVVEFDPTSGDKVYEEGSWFLAEERDAYVAKQLAILDDLLSKGR